MDEEQEISFKAVITVRQNDAITDIMEIDPTDDFTVIGFIATQLSSPLRHAGINTKISIELMPYLNKMW